MGEPDVVMWLDWPEDHDFPAAQSYLSLVCDSATAAHLVDQMRKATLQHFKAKDILRAAQLAVLAQNNAHVTSDLAKIEHGKPLAPVLMVRGDARIGTPAVIADGYHRVCASYYTDENTDIPVLMVGFA